MIVTRAALGTSLLLASAAPAYAQDTPAPSCLPQAAFAIPEYTSVEQLPDGRVTFRLCAPEADDVRVTSNDLDPWVPAGFAPGTERGLAMTKDATGLWSATTALPVPADNYRYNFQIDGVKVPDPMATTFSRERVGVNSTVDLPGEAGAFQAWHADVPHGTVTRVDYWSEPLGVRRGAYVYTPPGYMNGTDRYPVLYLVHGAGDSADSWTQVGHANTIIDNLIAAGRAQPMIVVMPFGHTPQRADAPLAGLLANGDFGADLHQALIPQIDGQFRTIADADHRAMAGLSMGGAHTIRFGLTRPDVFSRLGIFSMGLGMQPGDVPDYVAANDAALRRSAQELDLVYYAMGKDDFLYGTVAPTREMLDRYGIAYHYNETDGGHTWINWRRYLADFVPRLNWGD
ncbi:esterase [Alteraurantiacibacter buctensis]|uniref:Esterase n=1 Tax=Alteraurantiacibacter buctensis TaxID=1503981 RepID=A0A844YXT2_9SPHN|nr:esterase [Alteraurantiacibacter buctensis]MXO71992.1 esterase [Alteraurantiacibacter buctensis]